MIKHSVGVFKTSLVLTLLVLGEFAPEKQGTGSVLFVRDLVLTCEQPLVAIMNPLGHASGGQARNDQSRR